MQQYQKEVVIICREPSSWLKRLFSYIYVFGTFLVISKAHLDTTKWGTKRTVLN